MIMDVAPASPNRRLIIAALIIILVNLGMVITLAHLHWFGRVIAIVGLIFAGLVIIVRKDVAATPIWFIVLVTVAVQLPHLFLVPRTSDDAYRYVWDGRVLLRGYWLELHPAAQLRPAGRPRHEGGRGGGS